MSRKLIDVLFPPEPEPEPPPKPLWQMSDEELAVACRIAKARLTHESAPVLLDTTIEGAKQHGFDFLRDEFRIK